MRKLQRMTQMGGGTRIRPAATLLSRRHDRDERLVRVTQVDVVIDGVHRAGDEELQGGLHT